MSAAFALTPLPLSPGHILWRSGNGTVMRQSRIVTTRFATPVSADAGRRTVLAGPNPPPPTRSWRQKARNHVQSALREKTVRDRPPRPPLPRTLGGRGGEPAAWTFARLEVMSQTR